MIVTKSIFRTVVHERDGITMRVCTGQEQPDWHPDDIAFGAETPEGVVKVCCRRDVSKGLALLLAKDWVLSVAFMAGFCRCFYLSILNCLIAGYFFWSWRLVVSALCAAGFTLYIRSALNPIVHDKAGHWVNLRTGSTNLCGGTAIKRKARWP